MTDKWSDPEFLSELARGNGIYDAWAQFEPLPDPGYEDAYWEGYQVFDV